MKQLELKKLINRLSTELRQGLEAAAALCVRSGNKSIEIEHWLLQLFAEPGKEITDIITSQKLSSDRILESLEKRLNQLPSGFEGSPALARQTVVLIEGACLLAAVNFNQTVINAYHLILSLLNNNDYILAEPSLITEWQKVSRDALQAMASRVASDEVDQSDRSQSHMQSALEKYTTDLTELMRCGSLSKVVGRDDEIRQMIDILSRRRQNNPILVGDAGVGKTAIVEGFAQRIIQKEVPKSLFNVRVLSLDIGLLQAGASIKGEFESRLKDLVNEIKQSDNPSILFIDEAHTLIGAGGVAGQNDAANLLKPALARGEFMTIAATTWAEYKKFFEKDAALTRRFQPINVHEPDENTAIHMVRGILPTLEKHHGIRIHESAVVGSVKLSVKYLPDRLLPDKAISLLDTACSRVSLSQNVMPHQLQVMSRKQEYLEEERKGLMRDLATGAADQDQLQHLNKEIATEREQVEILKGRWQQEKVLVSQLMDLECDLDSQYFTGSHPDQRKKNERNRLESQLKVLQAHDPLLFPRVDMSSVAAVVSAWTGIPAGEMLTDEIEQLLSLEDSLHQRVVGQHQAIKEISSRIRVGRAGLSDPQKPVGVFLACGPSGVGKTETGLALAELLYGGRRNLIVINMTEYKEEHKVSALLGAPAGYVGYGEGGILTEAVRRHPYSVLILDEMEKAHPSVHDIFYRIFDKGVISDSEGRDVSFHQSIIIMTSNIADASICDLVEHFRKKGKKEPERKDLLSAINKELLCLFKAAFIGRTTVIPYLPLTKDHLVKICRMKLAMLENNLYAKYRASIEVDDDVVSQLIAWNQSPETGARSVDQLINRRLIPVLATECLSHLAREEPIHHVHIGLKNHQLTYSIT